MDISEAAEYLGVSTKTIKRLVLSGKLSARFEFIEEDLITFARRETTQPELLDKDGLEADQSPIPKKPRAPVIPLKRPRRKITFEDEEER